jgi:hypothetical protein
VSQLPIRDLESRKQATEAFVDWSPTRGASNESQRVQARGYVDSNVFMDFFMPIRQNAELRDRSAADGQMNAKITLFNAKNNAKITLNFANLTSPESALRCVNDSYCRVSAQ